MDEEGRWKRIWGICFPGREETPSPWVTEGVGLELTMVRDWWAAAGRTYVEGFLEGKGEWNQEIMEVAVVVIRGALEERMLEGR